MLITAGQAAAPCPTQQRLGRSNQRPRQLAACRANYRWSAGEKGKPSGSHASPSILPPAAAAATEACCQQHSPSLPCICLWYMPAETDGGHKRESLYGIDERSKALGGGGGASSREGNVAPDDAWSRDGTPYLQQTADWGQWPQGAAADAEMQQAEWEAAAAAIASERAARRAARRAAAGGRPSRRQQQEEQRDWGQRRGQPADQWSTEGQASGLQLEAEPAGPTSASGAAATDGPAAGASPRLLRRRQRAAAGRRRGTADNGVASAAAEAGAVAAGGPDAGQPGGGGWPGGAPDPWEAEWGPAAPAAAAAAAEDWGWAEESWAQDGSRRQRRRQQQQELQQQAAAEEGPGSAWDFAQQQAELRRRRRRRGRPDMDLEEAGASGADSAAGQQAQQQAGGWAGDAQATDGHAAPGAGFEYPDSSDEDEEEAGWQPGRQRRGAQYSAEFEPGLTAEPDIAVLSTGPGPQGRAVQTVSGTAGIYGQARHAGC